MLLHKIIFNVNSVRYSSYFALENLVKEENRAKTLANLKKIKLQRLHTKEVGKAAVLIPICVIDDKTSLLYTLRTSHLRSHKGQVSFPGGKHDEKDGTLEYTAIRETEEELGIDSSQIEIWGTGNFLTNREINILPVVGHIKTKLDLKTLNINQHEVEEVFAVSLENLCNQSKHGYTQFKDRFSAPVFLGGQRRIWGVTAIMTHIFLKSLLPSNVYYHKIKFIQSIKVNTN